MYASEINVVQNGQGDEQLEVTQEVDGGLQRLRLRLPCVVTSDLRLNTPRLCTLQNIMRAKTKPLLVEDVEKIITGVGDCKSTFDVVKTEEPPSRKSGIVVSSVDDLLHRLRTEAKVLP
jgi:electron transfer flavoprotein beta subunit